jgi:hypothetical protein
MQTRSQPCNSCIYIYDTAVVVGYSVCTKKKENGIEKISRVDIVLYTFSW